MGESKRIKCKTRFCFTVAVPDDDAEIPRHLRRRRLHRRVLAKIFRSSVFFLRPNRIDKERKEPNPSLAAKGFDSGDEYDWKSASIFSSSASASHSSSSSSSRLSLAAIAAIPAELEEPKPRLKRAPPPARVAEPPGKPPPRLVGISGLSTGMLLLVACLLMMVFFGRLWAIVWISSLLFLASCLCYGGVATEEEAGEGAPVTELRRRLATKAEERKRVILEGFLQRKQKF
ncbi:hypothetical protein Cni_G23868 [Canna indica]|uniref:Uncharacterized protein n=1 Tax=Canna indica TaxID=4628 RepID=A0AAQ3KTW2_9LILI|nr:hypothetical protein Cni_G23868 [Canna indica]